MPLDQQVSTICRPCRLCRQRAATYDFVGEEMPEGVRRIRCRGCGNETWLIKLKPFRCAFGRTFYPDGSIGPREAAQKD